MKPKPTFSFGRGWRRAAVGLLASWSALGAAGVAQAQQVSVSGTEFRVNGSRLWLNGANTPWKNWNDFGGNFDQTWWSNHFQTLKDNGINCTRVWLTGDGEVGINIAADGTVSGATQAHWTNLDQLFQIAQSKQIYVLATFISFDHGQDAGKHPNFQRWRNMLNSAAATQSYVTNYVVPFATRYKNNPYVFAVDVCNELEWYNENANCGNIAWANLQRYAGQVAAAVHNNSNMLVTLGNGPFVKYLSSIGGPKFTDAALQAQVADVAASLDFYSPHYFSYMYADLSQANPYTKSPAMWGLADKPCIVGETPAKGTTAPAQTLTQNYENAFQQQWQGVFAWTSNGVDANGDINDVGPATRAFQTNHAALVAPPALRPADNPSGAQSGLAYQYYEGTWGQLPNFANLTPAKMGTVANFDLSPRLRNDNFGFGFSGYVQVPTDGTYTFYTNSDDGSKLYVGDQLVVRNDGPHGARERSGTIGLKAGKHPIAVLYYDATGSETLGVSYAGPGLSKTAIPASALSWTATSAALGVYADGLAPDWADWSWSTTVNLANTAAPVKSGSQSASVTYTAAWAGFSLRKGTAVNTSGYSALKFWVHGGSGANKSIKVYSSNADSGGESTSTTFTATAGAWTEISVSLSTLGNPASIKKLTFQENGGAAQSAIYFDDIRLVPSSGAASRSLAAAPAAGAQPAPYPNPFADQLTVPATGAGQATEVRLLNALGQEVYRGAAPAGLGEAPLRLPALPAGVYVLQVKTGAQTRTYRVQKQAD